MTTIVETGIENATNTDILQATRLQTLMEGGVLSLEVSASDCDLTNNYAISLQMPNGKTAMNGVLVGQGGATAGVVGIMDERTSTKFRAVVGKGGGHPVFSCVETGDAEIFWRATYQDSR